VVQKLLRKTAAGVYPAPNGESRQQERSEVVDLIATDALYTSNAPQPEAQASGY